MKKLVLLSLAVALLYSCSDDNSIKEEEIITYDSPEISQEGSIVTMTRNKLSIEIDTAFGARIISYTYDGTEILSLYDQEGGNWGSTFWTAPQSEWLWPPKPEHDNLAYDLTIDGDAVKLAGDTSSKLLTYITKEFNFSTEEENTIEITYGVTETIFDKVSEIAHWEVTRVPSTGITFFEMEGDHLSFNNNTMEYTDSNSYFWLDLTADEQAPEDKVFSNGTGWIAHVDNNLLYLKSFEDISHDDAAKNEAEIEIYVSGDKPYIEIEPQSSAFNLVKDETRYWTVKWKIIEIPESVDITIGSQDLIDLAKNNL